MNRARNKWTRIVVVLSVIIMCFAMTTVSALGYEYTTDSYDVDVVVKKNNTYVINEKIAVDFAVGKHGIYRYIPVGSFKDMGYMKIDDINVEGYNYEYYTEDSNMIVKVGDGSVYVHGPQEYNISYKMEIYEDRDETRDFFYLDVLPTAWETPIESSTINIHFPKKIDKNDIEVYLGRYGDTESTEAYWGYDKSTKTLTIEADRLGQGVGITVLCNLPEGYWEGESGYGWAKAATMGLGALSPLGVVLFWFLFGRDKKIIPTVEFYPPEGMTPAEVGYVMDNTADKKDLLSLIMYYADKGYISIEEPQKNDFVITKLKDIDPNEKNFVQTLFGGLFINGDVVRVAELDESFGDRYLIALEQLHGHYFKKSNRQVTIASSLLQILAIVMLMIAEGAIIALANWYSAAVLPTVLGAVAMVVQAIMLFVAVVRNDKQHTMSKTKKVIGNAFTWALLIAVIGVFSYAIAMMVGIIWFTAVLAVLIVLACIAIVQMKKRTKKNIELMGKLIGLKDFIEKAELDKLNMLVEENPSYFYNILPYAYVMGLTDKWAKNFENIKISKPTWCDTGSMDMYDAWMMSRMLNNCNRRIASNIRYTMHEDSGGNGGGFGSGGGGFVGGGFGGGGGGSW